MLRERQVCPPNNNDSGSGSDINAIYEPKNFYEWKSKFLSPPTSFVSLSYNHSIKPTINQTAGLYQQTEFTLKIFVYRFSRTYLCFIKVSVFLRLTYTSICTMLKRRGQSLWFVFRVQKKRSQCFLIWGFVTISWISRSF